MKSDDKKAMDELYTEMYLTEEELIAEDNKRVSRQREVNKQILDLLRSQGISEEDIENFANFVRTQKVTTKGNYDVPERYHDRSLE